MIEVDLTTLLKAIETKTFPLIAPTNATAPFLIYSRVSTMRVSDFDGPCGLAMATFRVDCYHKSYLEARKLANRVRVALNGKQTRDYSITLEQELDLSDLESAPDLYRVNLEFQITHSEGDEG